MSGRDKKIWTDVRKLAEIFKNDERRAPTGTSSGVMWDNVLEGIDLTIEARGSGGRKTRKINRADLKQKAEKLLAEGVENRALVSTIQERYSVYRGRSQDHLRRILKAEGVLTNRQTDRT